MSIQTMILEEIATLNRLHDKFADDLRTTFDSLHVTLMARLLEIESGVDLINESLKRHRGA